MSCFTHICQLIQLVATFSYGPCQTPTLGFCVQRYLQMNTFKPEKFWSLHAYILQSGYELKLEWERQKLFDLDVRVPLLQTWLCITFPFQRNASLCVFLQAATMFQKLVMEDGIVEVTEISEKQEVKSRPPGLNTVNLLKVRNNEY